MTVVDVFAVYGVLLLIEAVVTYRRTGGKHSLIAGVLSAALALAAAVLVHFRVPIGASVGLGVILAMVGVFGSRCLKTKTFMPAGIMLGVSAIALGILFAGME